MHRARLRKVVLIGGGHAHVQVLEDLAARPLPDSELTVIVDTPSALYSGMVPGFVAGQYRREELEIDVERLAALAKARVVIAQAVRVDPRDRQIVLDDGLTVPYDVASFDIGSTVAGLDRPGVREHALPTRPIGVFVQQIDKIVERARGERSPFRVVVVGGGAGGVEVGYALQQRIQSGAPASTPITLLHNGPRLLAGHPESLVRRVYRRAEERGIDIRCSREVVAVRSNEVELDDGEQISCRAVLWITGPVSQPIFGESGLPIDERGFVRIRSTLQVEGHDELFAVGDCGTLVDYPKTPKAGVYAVRQGPFLTHNLRAWIAGKPLRQYRPQSDFLMLLNLGDGRALGTKWGRTFEGRWVMKLKDFIDRRFMRRFQSLYSEDAVV